MYLYKNGTLRFNKEYIANEIGCYSLSSGTTAHNQTQELSRQSQAPTRSLATDYAEIGTTQVLQYSPKPIISTVAGEVLLADYQSNVMCAISRKNNNTKQRYICNGIIKDCKIIRYVSGNQQYNYYIIETVAADHQWHTHHLTHEEFESKTLLNLLTDRGGLAFLHCKKDAHESELVQKYILNISKKSADVFPEFTCWINNKYFVATDKYNIGTPFFKHVCRHNNTDKGDATGGILNNLNILGSAKLRMFFLLLLHYVIIRELMPVEKRQIPPFYIYSDIDLFFVINALLGIFGDTEAVSLSEPQGIITKSIKKAKGSMILFTMPEQMVTTTKRVQENIDYVSSVNADTVIIVLCKSFSYRNDSGFHITINKADIRESYVNKSICQAHVHHFTNWMHDEKIDVSSIPSDSWLDLTYYLVEKYIMESNNSLALDNPYALIETLIKDSNTDLSGDWILEWLRDNILKLHREGKLIYLDLRKDVADFSTDSPVVCKKDDLLCIREKDLEKFLILCDEPGLNAGIVKQSLLDAGVLERDKNRLCKNIYIRSLKKSERMLAMIYDAVFPTGIFHIN